ncbi:MAG TPA: hypothetical protein VK009_09475 [Chloroflexota bacterium]|nr:hypothetical protein [Chloroflexota bacterium]
MADWNYEQLALRRPEDREEVVRRINHGWELVGLTTRGRGGRNVVHAIMRLRRPNDAAAVAKPTGREAAHSR